MLGGGQGADELNDRQSAISNINRQSAISDQQSNLQSAIGDQRSKSANGNL